MGETDGAHVCAGEGRVMKISDMMQKLTQIMVQHGDIPIYRYYDGWEYAPLLEVSNTDTVWDRDEETGAETAREVKVPKRCIIK